MLVKEYNNSSTIALLALQFLSVIYLTCRSSLVIIGIHYIVAVHKRVRDWLWMRTSLTMSMVCVETRSAVAGKRTFIILA